MAFELKAYKKLNADAKAKVLFFPSLIIIRIPIKGGGVILEGVEADWEFNVILKNSMLFCMGDIYFDVSHVGLSKRRCDGYEKT